MHENVRGLTSKMHFNWLCESKWDRFHPRKPSSYYTAAQTASLPVGTSRLKLGIDIIRLSFTMHFPTCYTIASPNRLSRTKTHFLLVCIYPTYKVQGYESTPADWTRDLRIIKKKNISDLLINSSFNNGIIDWRKSFRIYKLP